jgi:hypothetical protein
VCGNDEACTRCTAVLQSRKRTLQAQKIPIRVPQKMVHRRWHINDALGDAIYISPARKHPKRDMRKTALVDCESLAYIDEGVEGTDPTCSERTSN